MTVGGFCAGLVTDCAEATSLDVPSIAVFGFFGGCPSVESVGDFFLRLVATPVAVASLDASAFTVLGFFFGGCLSGRSVDDFSVGSVRTCVEMGSLDVLAFAGFFGGGCPSVGSVDLGAVETLEGSEDATGTD